MRPSRRFSLPESNENFAGGDAAASALDKVQEGPSAAKLAALPVPERPAGWFLRPLGRLLELGCVFRRERFPLLRHVLQLLAVPRVAHLIGDFAALDRTVEILQALTHRYLSAHNCLASACSARNVRRNTLPFSDISTGNRLPRKWFHSPCKWGEPALPWNRALSSGAMGAIPCGWEPATGSRRATAPAGRPR